MVKDFQFVEFYNKSGGGTIRDYALRTIYINPDHVVCLREDDATGRLLKEGRLPAQLDERQEFTKIVLNRGTQGQEITVVGPVASIHKKLFETNKILLRG
jgi:hypothetical protein